MPKLEPLTIHTQLGLVRPIAIHATPRGLIPHPRHQPIHNTAIARSARTYAISKLRTPRPPFYEIGLAIITEMFTIREIACIIY